MKSNVLLVALSGAVLAACGAGGGSASDPTTLGLTSTNYVTVTQTPTTLATTTLPLGTPNPGTVHPEEGSYVVASGDLPSTIARNFKVKFVDLLNINGWTLVGSGNSAQVPEFPGVGTTIRIPPGWTEPGTAADTSGTTATGTTPSTGTTTTVAGGQSTCAPGEYTILAGDFEGKVAKKLDTTVDALRAANAATPNYKSFFPGLKIKTPPKANC
jgi:LysM repeat protein